MMIEENITIGIYSKSSRWAFYLYTAEQHTEFKKQKTQIDVQIVAFNRASKFTRFYFCGIPGMVLNPSI